MRLIIATLFLSLSLQASAIAQEQPATGEAVPLIAVEREALKAKSCGIYSSRETHIHQARPDVNHVPDADVNYGANQNAFQIADPIVVPIAIDVLKYMNIDIYEGLEGDANLSNVFIYRDGRIVYNGVDITNKFQNLCAEEKVEE
jgi:hypothetical protein